jgi:hypothetical protein
MYDQANYMKRLLLMADGLSL